MKKFIIITVVMLAALQCTSKNQQSIDTTEEKSQQLIDSAIVKNNEAVMLYLHAMGRVDSLNKAINLLDEAIAIDPKCFVAYTNKVQYLNELGKTKEAQNFNDLALTKFPESQDLYFRQGLFYETEGLLDLAQKSYNQSLAYYDRAIEKKSDDFGLIISRVLIKMFAENRDTSTLVEELKNLQKKYDNESEEYEHLNSFQKMFSETNRADLVKDYMKN